jgi:hypothetical protein
MTKIKTGLLVMLLFVGTWFTNYQAAETEVRLGTPAHRPSYRQLGPHSLGSCTGVRPGSWESHLCL